MADSTHQTESETLKGFLYALGSTVLLSTNFVTAKYALKGFNFETFSLIWTAAAAFYSLVIIVVSGQSSMLIFPSHARSKIALMGLCTGVGMLLGWAGLALLDPSLSQSHF